jgi:bifunctional non-homologous end joining protein LigD
LSDIVKRFFLIKKDHANPYLPFRASSQATQINSCIHGAHKWAVKKRLAHEFVSSGMAKANALTTLTRQGTKSPMPSHVKPMLCTLTKTPVRAEGYIHEIKWDGYRLLAHSNKGSVRLDSRSGLNYTNKYPPLQKALKKLGHDFILDGEAVVLNETGKPDFDALQNFNGHDDPIYFYAFDILWLDGYDLMELTLLDRKNILALLLAGNEVIRYSEHFADGPALYKQMQEMELEGIVSKKAISTYNPGERGMNWYKTPTEIRQEFVIGGWIESDKARPFRSLLFGAYKDKQFEWIGHAGGGFKDSEMPAIMKKLKPLEIKRSPFVNEVDTDGKAHWVKPEIVANFKFATWTKSGRIRKPAIFLGFRNDKKPGDVSREIAKDQTADGNNRPALNETVKKVKFTSTEKRPAQGPKKSPASSSGNWPLIENQKIRNEDVFKFDDCNITINNIDREVWKGITKADVIGYYHSVAGFILPHIINRPQSLHIKPVNANAPGFYIKDMEGREPECAEIFSIKRKHKAAGKRDMIDYLVANNEATLMYMINLGCIDINPWTSTIASPGNPDYIIIDLDPSDEDFNKAVETAKAAKEFFDKAKLKAFLKTSGKTGIHIYIPCINIDFKNARSIAEAICAGIQTLVPAITTTEVSVSNRGDKLYIDPSQNDFADTVAAPYSVRPFHKPTVSAPLEWKELKGAGDALQFDIHSIQKRLQRKGDLFAGVTDKKIATANTKLLQKMF